MGIDFGTSSTVAVVALPPREPRPLLFDGSPLLPSAVCLDPTGRIVTGQDAVHTAMADPSAFEPYPKQRVDDGTVLLAGSDVSVSALFQAVLGRVLVEAATVDDRFNDAAAKVVVTCPAAWGSARRAILLAAAPPGTRLIDEPIAAAHYFTDIAGNDLPEGGFALVYDFGAGTFDTAVVRRVGNGFTTIAALGVSDCGGLDIDAAVVAHLADAGHDADTWRRLDNPTTSGERRARLQLWSNVRAAKEMLSRTSTTLIHLPLLEVEVPLGREELDQLSQPILDRTVAAVREVLKVAGLGPADVATIYLSGGSSRMPAVVTSLHRALGIVPATVDQPELAVAEGGLRAAAALRVGSDPGGPALLGALGALEPVGVPAPAEAEGAGAADRLPGRRRRLWLAAAAAAAVVGVITVSTVLVTALRGDDSTSAVGPGPATATRISAAATPSPSYPPGIDPCLLGSWRVTSNQVYGLIGNVRVLYSGGAGVLYTYRANGTFLADYAKMQPRYARYNGDVWSDVHRGTASFQYYAANGMINSNLTQSDAIDTLRRNGKVDVTAPVSYLPEPEQYRCTGNKLYDYSAQGNFSVSLERVSKPSAT